MRRQQQLFSGFIALSLLASMQLAWGQTQEVKLDQSFNVTKSTKLRIDSRFGKVHINTWTQNRIEVKVLAEASGSESEARAILDRITIDVDESSSTISLETEIAESRKRNRNQRFKIDYTVKMPVGNPLDLEHRHGDIYLDNFQGPLVLELAHGQIVAEELTGTGDISLQHGSGGRITALGQGELEIQHYQNFRIGKLGSTKVEVAHSSLEVEEAGDFDAEIRHSKVDLASAGATDISLQHSTLTGGDFDKVSADMQHSELSLKQLKESINADGSHSQVKIARLLKGFSTVEFDGNHSYLSLGLESGASANLDVNLHFGNLKYSESDINMTQIIKENHNSQYKGTIGSSPSGKILVKGSFTDFKLGR